MSKAKRISILDTIAAAVREEHPPETCAADCEIAVGLRNGLVIYASRKLRSSTECPLTEEATEKYLARYGDKTYHRQWEEGLAVMKRLPQWQCPHCYAVNYEDQGLVASCGACGKTKGHKVARVHIELFIAPEREDHEIEDALRLLESKLGKAQGTVTGRDIEWAHEYNVEHLVKDE